LTPNLYRKVRRDASTIGKIERKAPPEIRDFLQSEDFWATAAERYRELDVDNSGSIEADELFPVIMELIDSQAWVITETHCKKVLKTSWCSSHEARCFFLFGYRNAILEFLDVPFALRSRTSP